MSIRDWWDDIKPKIEFPNLGRIWDGFKDWLSRTNPVGEMREIAEQVVATFYEEIIRPAINALVDAIAWLEAEIKVWKHELKKTLAKWLENDLFFTVFVTLMVVTIVFLPKWVEWFKSTKVWTLAVDMVEKIKDGVVKYIDVHKLIDLHTLDVIMRIFWDDYRELMSQWTEAVASLAAELGEGSAYILAGSMAIRSIVHGYHAVMGLPPETAELKFYEGAAKQAADIDDHFRRYAHNPGYIYRDMMDNWLIPEATTLREVHEGQANDIREAYDRSIEVEDGLKEMQQGISDLIVWLPGEIEYQFARRWEPINEWLNDRWYILDNEILPKINATITALEERERDHHAANQAAIKNAAQADAMLNSYYGLSPERQKAYREDSANIDFGADGESTDVLREGMLAYDRSVPPFAGLTEIPVIPALGLEAEGAVHVGGKAKGDIPSPFVGDY